MSRRFTADRYEERKFDMPFKRTLNSLVAMPRAWMNTQFFYEGLYTPYAKVLRSHFVNLTREMMGPVGA